jgi:hypothetical protein
MSENLKALLLDGSITIYEYDNYVLFEMNELGKSYLKNVIESTFLEIPDDSGYPNSYAMHAVRISVWREIKLIIIKVTHLLEKYNDGNPRQRSKRDRTELDIFTDRI